MIKLEIKRVINNVVAYQEGVALYTFERSKNEIDTKSFVDTLKLNYKVQIEYDIDYVKVEDPSKEDIFSNYVHDYLSRFLKDVKTYLDTKNGKSVPEHQEEAIQKTLFVADDDLPF